MSFEDLEMNILYLSKHLNTGGITTYLLTLTQGFVHRGHNVFVISSGGDQESEFLSAGAKLHSIDIRTKSELSFKLYGNLINLKKFIVKNDIEIIHAQTRVTQIMGQLTKRLTGCPYVSTCHGYFKAHFSRKLFPCWGDRVIAISSPVVKHLKEDFHVSDNQIELIVNGINLNQFEPVDEESKIRLRRRYHLGKHPVIGIIARLSDVKGQDLLVAAFHKVVASFPQAKLFLVGEGKMENALRRLVSTLDLVDKVIFLPKINKTSEILPIFDVFVMPSRQEGLGISVMEAQAAGLPVVASNVGGLPDIIEDGKTGILVRQGDVGDLSEAIIFLLRNKQAAMKMGKLAKMQAKKRYSADTMVEKTLAVYEKVREHTL